MPAKAAAPPPAVMAVELAFARIHAPVVPGLAACRPLPPPCHRAPTCSRGNVSMLLRRSTWRALPVALVSLWLASCTSAPVKSGQPVVVADHARFSFLTPPLVRMEYSPGG